MAQQKMHCAVRSTYNDEHKVYVGRKFYSQNRSLEKDNFKTSSEDSHISSLSSRNSDNRCAILTVYTPESVGLWRIVTVPPACHDNKNQFGSVTQQNMDGLHLVSPSTINSFKVDRRKARKGPVRDVTYPVKPFTPRSFPGSEVRNQSRNRNLATKTTKLNEVSSNFSSKSSVTCNSKSSSVIQQKIYPFGSANIFIDGPKVGNVSRRNSRNKARKKGKHNRKVSREFVSSGPLVLSTDHVQGVLPSKTVANVDSNHGDGSVSCETSIEDSFLDRGADLKHVEDNSNGISNGSDSPKTCTSYIDEVNLSEAELPSDVPNFSRGHLPSDSKMMIQLEDQGSVTDGGVEERVTHPILISSNDGTQPNGLSDLLDCRALDSVSDGSNSEHSISATYDAKPYDRESNKSSVSESVDFRSEKGCFSPPNLLSSVVDFCDYTEGNRYSNLGLNSSDLRVAIPGKRNKKAKMVPGTAIAFKPRGDRNACERKESNHCVWQKVQKNDVHERKCESNPHATLKKNSPVGRNHDVSDVDISSKSEDKKLLKDKLSRKLKRKINPGSKQEHNSCYRRAMNPSKTSSNALDKVRSQQNETLDISAELINQKGDGSAPMSCSQIGSVEFGFHRSKVESLNSETYLSSLEGAENLELIESVSNTLSAIKEPSSSLDKPCRSLERMKILDAPSPVFLPDLMVAQTVHDTSLAENSKQNHTGGLALQKWIPVGTKNPQSTTTDRCGNLHAAGQGTENWTLRNSVFEKAASNSQNLISSLNVGMMSMGLESENKSLWVDKDNSHVMGSVDAHSFNRKNNDTDCLISESKYQTFTAVETDINKIAKAVGNACRMQLASEAVQVATGGPLAEFERFLHLSSPVIGRSHNSISHNDFLEDQIVGASLCRHEIPNVSLGCLWQWYEKHGSYGLEVRAEDYEHSKRLGVDRFSFRAYFVPYLSAVQLFKNCRIHSSNTSAVLRTSGVSRISGQILQNSANISNLPILSVLIPQPRTSDASCFPPVKELCRSEQCSVSDIENLSVPSVPLTRSDDLELLFEYFESEQPRQRRPLYEKIQELVTGEGPSNCRVYGDPSHLNTSNLQDLHPLSWYSVAWYPIYRIPDGNFRAAFLTFHSLGHMVHRSAKNDSSNKEACIISPAVGLQSYNAQSECWFQLRHSALGQTEEASNLNISEVLKERLRTLEETASVMSRAVVNKGNQMSVNRHSDYEFFLSRRHSGLP